MSGELTEAVVAALRDGAREAGLPRFGVTALEDETLRRSQGVLQDFLRRGFHGEMQFLEVTATMRGQPSTLLEGARAALVVAVPYGGEGAPIARYAQWADYHTIVHRRLERVVQHLDARGLLARAHDVNGVKQRLRHDARLRRPRAAGGG